MTLPSTASIRWQCRRGMLELDMLLFPFVDTVYEGLSAAQKHAFVTLLTYPDQELYEWLIGKSYPIATELAAMVELIRAQLVWKE